MENEKSLGKPDDPIVESANKIILEKENLTPEDIRGYLEANLLLTNKYMQETTDRDLLYFFENAYLGENKALMEWNKSKHTAVEILLLQIYTTKKTGIETTPRASRKCVELLLSQPLVKSNDEQVYKKIITEAGANAERIRARDNEFFPVYRAYIAALEYNAEKFTLLYGRVNRKSRLRMREDKFNTLFQRLGNNI